MEINYFSLRDLVIHCSLVVSTFNITIPSLAQTQLSSIEADNTLGNEKSIVTNIEDSKTIITGGAVRNNTLLFHSFDKFSVDNNVIFSPNSNIENIITRVTGKSASDISGILGVEGKANLFLLNPNGIKFENGASLSLTGSFFVSTADSLVFDNTFEFSASTKQAPPTLLTVSIPVAFRFGGISQSIVNESDLQINAPRIILLGGEVLFRNFNAVEAPGTNVEIGGVAPGSLVSISLSLSKFTLDYKDVKEFQDIYISQGFITTGDNNGKSSGNIQLSGKNITITNGAQIGNLNDGNSGGDISVNASQSLFVINESSLNALSTENGIAIGSIDIIANNLILGDRSFIEASNNSINKLIKLGDITIVADDSIEIFGNSQISSQSFSSSNAGNVTLKTTKLYLRQGGQISSASAFDSNGGNINIDVSEFLEINGKNRFRTSGLFARSNGGNSGNILIKNAKNINVLNGATISVSSRGVGSAGNINIINVDTLSLNTGLIEATTDGGKGEVSIDTKKLILRNDSLISTNATNSADGGNIKIDTPILLALPPTQIGGSDIVANAVPGAGGKITINSQGIFGIQQRKAEPRNQTNDIDASSQFGQSGQVQINTTTDPNQGLVELPATVVDPSTLVAQNPCKRASSSEFTRSGRGGLPPSLSQDLNGESIQVGLVEPANVSADKPESKSDFKQASSVAQSSSQIAPAQGWVFNSKGEVVLVAYNSAVTSSQRIQTTPAGCPVF